MNHHLPQISRSTRRGRHRFMLGLVLSLALISRPAAHGDHGIREAAPALGLGPLVTARSDAPTSSPPPEKIEVGSAVFHVFSLAPVANAPIDFSNDWPERLWKREMSQLPRGDSSFAGIPFHVVDQTEADGRAAVTLVGGRYDGGPAGGATLDLGERSAAAIYVLHAASYQNLNAGRLMARYAITYADGSRWDVPVRNKQEAADFLNPEHLTADCVVGWLTKHRVFPNSYGVYVTRLVNPSPDKALASISFEPAQGAAIVSVLGLTLGETSEPLLASEEIKFLARPQAVAGPAGRLVLHILAEGAPTVARVSVLGPNGASYQPWYGLNYTMLGRPGSYFYADGEVDLPVPAAQMTVRVARGFEYRPVERKFTIPQNGTVEETIQLDRWINLPQMGWYSGEMHIHPFDQEPEDTAACLLGEDLHVANLLVWGNGFIRRFHSDQFFRGRPEAWPDSTHVAYYNEEFRNNTYGHLCLVDLKELVYPMGTGPEYASDDYPPNAAIMDRVHDQEGYVSVAHLSIEPANYAVPWEVGVDVALGKADSVDIDLTSFDRTKDRSLDLWYRLLNCGFRIPATCGTDAFTNSPWINLPVGNVRAYGYVGDTFTYDRWIETMRQGRSFVTRGPAVFLSVDGVSPGEALELPAGTGSLRIQSEAFSLYPLQSLEIVMNGEVVASSDESTSDGTRWRIALDQDLDVVGSESLWFAARAKGVSSSSFLKDPLLAHTNPVFGTGVAPQRSADDAQFFIDEINGLIGWVEGKGRFADPAHRAEVKALFESARDLYESRRSSAAIWPDVDSIAATSSARRAAAQTQ